MKYPITDPNLEFIPLVYRMRYREGVNFNKTFADNRFVPATLGAYSFFEMMRIYARHFKFIVPGSIAFDWDSPNLEREFYNFCQHEFNTDFFDYKRQFNLDFFDYKKQFNNLY